MSMFVLDYDEFGMYVTEEEVKNYVKSLIDNGDEKETVLEKCKNEFGDYLCSFIEYIVYDKD